jgi:MoaA/NifB/PqqE/SkfB family radical SAM enzyme
MDNEIYTDNVENLKRVLHYYHMTHFFTDATPLTISFLITNRCILRCKHCFNHRTSITDDTEARNELTIDEIGKMSKSMGFFLNALLCGGEPFLRDDLHEIVYMFRVNNKTQAFSSSTNGQLTERIVDQMEHISQYSKYQNYSMNFSFEGFEEESEEIRGKGTFKKSIETWNECKKLNKFYGNIIQNVVITMNSINQATLPRFFEWVNENLHPNRIMLLLVRQSPRGGEYLKEVDPQNYEAATRVLNRYTLEGKYGDYNKPTTYIPASQYYYINETLKTGKRSYLCYAGKHGAFIDYDGEVNACEVFNDARCNNKPVTMGNLRDFDMNFLKLWNSKQAMEVKQLINRHEICKSCTHETEGILPSIYFEPNFFGKESIEPND